MEHEGVSSEVALALRSSGYDVVAGPAGLHVHQASGAPPALLRVKGSFWLLDIPQPANAPVVIKALGRLQSTPSREIVEKVQTLLGPHRASGAILTPGRSELSAPRLAARNPAAAAVLDRLRPSLTGAAGLSGRVHEQLFGADPRLTLESVHGTLVVSIVNDHVVVDTEILGDATRLVIGLVGRPEAAMARRAVAAVRALTGERHRSTGRSMDLAHVVGPLHGIGAYLATADDGIPVIVVPPTGTHHGSVLHEVNRVLAAAGSLGLHIFGAFGSQTPADIADEVVERLRLSMSERDEAARAWAAAAPELRARLGGLADLLEPARDDAALRAVHDVAQDVLALEHQGGLVALESARRLVRDLESAVLAPTAGKRGTPPPPRLIRQWSDAEVCAAEWMEWFGLGAATLTGGSADGGVDVVCELAIGQVKDYGTPLSAGPVREAFAVAQLEGKQAVVFARAGFTADALAWAERARMALFTFDLQGTPEPVSEVARELMDA